MSVPLQLFFGASDVSFLLLRDGNLTYDKNVNQRWTCSFNLQEPATASPGAHRPVAGQTFTLYEDGVLTFSGFIDQITEVALESTSIIQYQCQCSSWATVCDHRIVTADYIAGDIAFNVIQDIVTRFLAGDGITITTHVDGSAFLPSDLLLNPSTVADAFDQIRDLIGRQWWIDENKDLHFTIVGLGSNTGITINGPDLTAQPLWLNGTMQVKRTTAQYRNQQLVQTGIGLGTATRTESFIGDGINFFFVTKFPVTSAPTVTVGGTPQTIYKLGTDAYGQNGWYWNPSGPGVQQGQQIPPGIGVLIQVTYDALTVNYAIEQNNTQIAARAAIEGDSGIWAQITNQNNILDLATAQAYASGLLSNFDAIPSVVLFQTYVKGFTIGDYITMNVSMHALSGQFTILEVSAQEQPSMVQNPSVPASVGGQMLFTVTVSDQQGIGNFVQWFTGLVNSIKDTLVTPGTGGSPQPTGVGGQGLQGIHEVPAGVINGSNTVFTTTYVPLPPMFWLFLNGVAQDKFVPNYSLSGNTITFVNAPQVGDQIFVEYFIFGPGGTAVSTNLGIVSTGVNFGGGLATPATVDQNWQMIVSADPSFPPPNAIVVQVLHSSWVANPSDAQWIAPEANANTAINTPGIYTWRLQFTLNTVDPATLVVKGNYAADNTTEVQINGVTVIAAGSGGRASLTPFTFNSNFTSGLNTIDFIVTNDPPVGTNPSGVLVEITSVTAVPSAPSGTATIIKETPSGSINGSNTAFSVSQSPGSSILLFLNGIAQRLSVDYTITASAVTFANAPVAGDVMVAYYVPTISTLPASITLQTPSGSINGSNTVFTLATAPATSAAGLLFLNGVFQKQGTDYTLTSGTVTYTNAPQSGDTHFVATLVASTLRNAQETPTGTQNGSNTGFGLSHPPSPSSGLLVFMNGIFQSTADVTLVSSSITYALAPASTDQQAAVFVY